MTLRILNVVPTYLPALRYGGPIYSVHGLAKALARLGHHVEVFTTNVNGPADSPVLLGEPVNLDGVWVTYFKVPWLRRLYWSPSMASALDRRLEEFDLVHIHSVFLWPTSAAARTARRRGVPYVISPRGMLVKELVRKKSRYLKFGWIAAFEKRNLEAAAVVHVTSREEARSLSEFKFRLRCVEVIPNGIDIFAETLSSNTTQAEGIGADRRVPILLFLGRISWKKGLDRLITALQYLPRCKAIIAGNDDENYQGDLIRLAERLGVMPRLTFVGPVFAVCEKAALFRQASLLLLPSYSENFGNVVLEAMAHGCPVVVTPEVGAADIVRECGGGVVVSGEPEALARAVNELLEDGLQLARMGESGRKTVRDNYGWDVVAREVDKLYQHAIHGY